MCSAVLPLRVENPSDAGVAWLWELLSGEEEPPRRRNPIARLWRSLNKRKDG
jgi:hypothetical protein